MTITRLSILCDRSCSRYAPSLVPRTNSGLSSSLGFRDFLFRDRSNRIGFDRTDVRLDDLARIFRGQLRFRRLQLPAFSFMYRDAVLGSVPRVCEISTEGRASNTHRNNQDLRDLSTFQWLFKRPSDNQYTYVYRQYLFGLLKIIVRADREPRYRR